MSLEFYNMSLLFRISKLNEYGFIDRNINGNGTSLGLDLMGLLTILTK